MTPPAPKKSSKASPPAPARKPAPRATKAPARRALPSRRVILGLLGGIASGKSSVAAALVSKAQARIVDADALARSVLDACARDGRLVEALGPWAVKGGAPDRKAIAKRVFDEPSALRTLERLTHPAITAQIDDAIASHRCGEGPAVLVLDVPLLLEVGLDRSCDELWFVDAPDAERFARAKARLGLTKDEVLKREAAQSPLTRKRERADRVLENRGDLTALEAAVAAALSGLLG
ncbi:MAG: dephospho-CoA kinase [Planctomycetes bacterium]|nr:dephospho-CoA kinase [Planctomycetota bacterium]